jgi:hypothetical protein
MPRFIGLHQVNIQISDAQLGLAVLAAHIEKSYNRRLTTLEYLSALYPPTVSVEQLAQITCLHAGTIRNQLSGENPRFPIPSFRQGKKRCFSLVDVAVYLDGLHAQKVAGKRKRGRPRKAEQIARRQAAQAG